MTDVTIRQVRTFLAVARQTSFRRAADRLSASQSSVTVQIRELEDRLGLPLLERTTRSVRLTSAGAELIPEFEQLISVADGIRMKSSEIVSGRIGKIHVAVLPSLAADFLPKALARFQLEYPEVQINIKEGVEKDLVEEVKANTCDFALTSARMLERGLHFEALFCDELVAVMPADDPLGTNTSVSLHQLIGRKLIFTPWGTSLRLAVEQAFETEGLKVSPAFEVTYLATAMGFAREGLGIALVPAATARNIAYKNTATIPISNSAGSRMMGILQISGVRAQPMLLRLFDLLRMSGLD